MNNQYNGVNLNKGDQPGQNQQGYNYGQPGQNQQGYNYSQPGQNPQGYNNVPPKAPAGPNVLTFALDYIKGFFSADPMAVLDKAVNEKQHVWSILGGGSVLLVTLAVFGILRNSILSILALFSGYSFFGYDVDLTGLKAKVFFFVLLTVAAFFFASAGINTLFFYAQKQKADYIQNMNILSAANLPLAVCGAAAFLISFIYNPVAVLLLVAGVIFRYIMLFEALKKASASTKINMWYVFGLVGANVVALSLIAYLLGKIML